MAAEKGRFGTVISLLVDKGADINVKDINGVMFMTILLTVD